MPTCPLVRAAYSDKGGRQVKVQGQRLESLPLMPVNDIDVSLGIQEVRYGRLVVVLSRDEQQMVEPPLQAQLVLGAAVLCRSAISVKGTQMSRAGCASPQALP